MTRVEIDFNEFIKGYEALSIVDNPAIGENFIALSEQVIRLAKMKDGRLIGAILIPDLDIRRVDANGNEYFIFFSKDTVRKIGYQIMKENKQSKFNLKHEKEVEGLTIVESWIIEDCKIDKSALYGFDLPIGTLMGVVEVNNDETKMRIEAGELKGFSIEYNRELKEEDALEQVFQALNTQLK